MMDTSASLCHPVRVYGINLSWIMGFKGQAGADLGMSTNERDGRCDMGQGGKELPPLEMPTS